MLRNSLYSFIVWLLHLGNASAQTGHSELLKLVLNADSIVYDASNKSAVVSYTFCAVDDVTTYGLSGVPSAVPFGITELCVVGDVGTGLGFAVFNSVGKQEGVRVTIHDEFEQKAVTREVLDSIIKLSDERFIASKQILRKRNKPITFTKEILLDDLELNPGIYSLQLVYYCGEKIRNVRNLRIMQGEPKLFEGCVFSQKIRFIVR